MKKLTKKLMALMLSLLMLLTATPTYANDNPEVDTYITIVCLDELAIGQEIDSVSLKSLSMDSLSQTGTIDNVKWYIGDTQTNPGDKFLEDTSYKLTFEWTCKNPSANITKGDNICDVFDFYSVPALLTRVDPYGEAYYCENADKTTGGWRDLENGSATKFVSMNVDTDDFMKQLDLYYFYKNPVTDDIEKISSTDLFFQEGRLLDYIYFGTSPNDCTKLDLSTVTVEGSQATSDSTIEEGKMYHFSFNYAMTEAFDPTTYLVYLEGKSLQFNDTIVQTLLDMQAYTLSDDEKTIEIQASYICYVDGDIEYSLNPTKVGDSSIAIDVTGDNIPSYYVSFLMSGTYSKEELLTHQMYLDVLPRAIATGMYDSQSGKIVFDFNGFGNTFKTLDKNDYTLFIMPAFDDEFTKLSYKGAEAINFKPSGNVNDYYVVDGMKKGEYLGEWFNNAADDFDSTFYLDPISYFSFNILSIDDVTAFMGDDQFNEDTQIKAAFVFLTEGEISSLTLKPGIDSDFNMLPLSKNNSLDFFDVDPSDDPEGYSNKYERALYGYLLDDDLKDDIIDYYKTFDNCFNSIYLKNYGVYATIARVTFDFKPAPVSSGGSSKTYKAKDTNDTAEKISGSGKKGSTRTITPIEGKKVSSVIVKDKNGNKVDVTLNADGTYSFVQPASDVNIEVNYKNREITLNIGSTEASVDGEKSNLDVSPVVRNDRTMLPIRFVAENLGAKVEWNEKKPDYVAITRGDTKIEITLGSDVMLVNGKEVKLDSVAFAENDRTYLPVRAISEALNAIVEWNEERPMEVKIYER